MEWVFIFLVVVFVLLLSGVRMTWEYQRAVVFRWRRYRRIAGPGLYWLVPLGIESQQVIDNRTQTVSVEPQETITKDSVTIRVNAVLWFRVVDPSKAVISVANYQAAVYQVALTTLRNIIGQHALDEVLRERDQINGVLKKLIDIATEPWGIEVQMVEMKDVEIPQSMQRAMAREAEATREKRARIIKAEAELESSQKLSDASRHIAQYPAALELRRMQMISEVGAEHNTTTIIMLPTDFVTLAKSVSEHLDGQNQRPRPEDTPR